MMRWDKDGEIDAEINRLQDELSRRQDGRTISDRWMDGGIGLNGLIPRRVDWRCPTRQCKLVVKPKGASKVQQPSIPKSKSQWKHFDSPPTFSRASAAWCLMSSIKNMWLKHEMGTHSWVLSQLNSKGMFGLEPVQSEEKEEQRLFCPLRASGWETKQSEVD